MKKKNNVKITKEMLNEIYKHDYETDSHLINPYLIDNEKLLSLLDDKWVSVNDRLPKKVDGRIRSNAYHVSLNDNHSEQRFAEYHFGDKQWIDIFTRQNITPTHWMDQEIDDKFLEVCKKLNEELIGPHIESTKFEDIPNAIADTLSQCLKKKVTVNGSGLDGNDLTAKTI